MKVAQGQSTQSPLLLTVDVPIVRAAQVFGMDMISAAESPLLTMLSCLLSRGHCLLRMNDTSIIVHPSLSYWDTQIHLPRESPP